VQRDFLQGIKRGKVHRDAAVRACDGSARVPHASVVAGGERTRISPHVTQRHRKLGLFYTICLFFGLENRRREQRSNWAGNAVSLFEECNAWPVYYVEPRPPLCAPAAANHLR